MSQKYSFGQGIGILWSSKKRACSLLRKKFWVFNASFLKLSRLTLLTTAIALNSYANSNTYLYVCQQIQNVGIYEVVHPKVSSRRSQTIYKTKKVKKQLNDTYIIKTFTADSDGSNYFLIISYFKKCHRKAAKTAVFCYYLVQKPKDRSVLYLQLSWTSSSDELDVLTVPMPI